MGDRLLGDSALLLVGGRLIALAGVLCVEPGEGDTTQIELASGSIMKVGVPYEEVAAAYRRLHQWNVPEWAGTRP